MVKSPPAMQEMQGMPLQSLGQEVPLEEGLAAHSSILARRIPRTEEPGRLQSIGSQSQTQMKQPSTHTHTHTHTYIPQQADHCNRTMSLNTDPHKYENLINDRTLKIIYKYRNDLINDIVKTIIQRKRGN